MVKLTAFDGGSMYVVPDDVRAIWPSGEQGCSAISVKGVGFALTVRGTPDEVREALRAREGGK